MRKTGLRLFITLTPGEEEIPHVEAPIDPEEEGAGATENVDAEPAVDGDLVSIL